MADKKKEAPKTSKGFQLIQNAPSGNVVVGDFKTRDEAQAACEKQVNESNGLLRLHHFEIKELS